MIGDKSGIWNPYYLNLAYGVDGNISQVYRFTNWSSAISKGSGNTWQTSGHKYFLDFNNAASNNFLSGAMGGSNWTQGSFSIYLHWEFDGSLATTYFCGNGNGTSADQFYFRYDNSVNQLQCRIYEATGSLSETATCSWTPSLNTRYFLCITYDGTDLTFFIDGSSQTTSYSNKTNFNTYMAGATITNVIGVMYVAGGGGTIGAEGKLFGTGNKLAVFTQHEIDLLYNFYSRY